MASCSIGKHVIIITSMSGRGPALIMLILFINHLEAVFVNEVWIKRPGKVYVCEGHKASLLWEYDHMKGDFVSVFIRKIRPEIQLLASVKEGEDLTVAPRIHMADTFTGFTISDTRPEDDGAYEIQLDLRVYDEPVSVKDEAVLVVIPRTDFWTSTYCAGLSNQHITHENHFEKNITRHDVNGTMTDVPHRGMSPAIICGIVSLPLVWLVIVGAVLYRVYKNKQRAIMHTEAGAPASCLDNFECLLKYNGNEALNDQLQMDDSPAQPVSGDLHPNSTHEDMEDCDAEDRLLHD